MENWGRGDSPDEIMERGPSLPGQCLESSVQTQSSDDSSSSSTDMTSGSEASSSDTRSWNPESPHDQDNQSFQYQPNMRLPGQIPGYSAQIMERGPSLPGQCLESSVQVPPRVTSQLSELYSLEENGVRPTQPILHDMDGIHETQSSDDSSSSSTDMTSGSEASSSDTRSWNPESPHDQDNQSSQYLPNMRLPGQIPGYSAQIPYYISEMPLPGLIPGYGTQAPLRFSSEYPGFIIPEEWFQLPELPDPGRRPNLQLMNSWFANMVNRLYSGEANAMALVPYQNILPSRTEPPAFDSVSMECTCRCNIKLSTKPLIRMYRALRSGYRRAAQRIRRAFHHITNE